MHEQIALSQRQGHWVATFTGQGEARIRELFGSNMIPTPFSASTPANTVLVAIRLRNEGAAVSIAGHPANCAGCADTNEAHS